MRIVEKKGLISLNITIVHSVLVVGINEILNRQNENVTVTFASQKKVENVDCRLMRARIS